MTKFEELNADQKKLNWLLGLEKETLADMAHQQSKIIEKLQKTAKAQAVPQWIPVNDPPKEIGRYWCYVEEQNDIGVSHYQWNCSWNCEEWGSEGLTGVVTHWMPLPAAPVQAKDGE